MQPSALIPPLPHPNSCDEKRSCNVFEMFTLYCGLRLKQNLEREDQRENNQEARVEAQGFTAMRSLMNGKLL